MDLVKKVKKAHAAMLIRKGIYDEAKENYDNAVLAYKEVAQKLEERDLEQAIIDGRLRKVSYGQGKPKPLTNAQKIKIIKLLNKEEEDED